MCFVKLLTRAVFMMSRSEWGEGTSTAARKYPSVTPLHLCMESICCITLEQSPPESVYSMGCLRWRVE